MSLIKINSFLPVTSSYKINFILHIVREHLSRETTSLRDNKIQWSSWIGSLYFNRLIPQIPQCTCPISHNAHFCSNVVGCGPGTLRDSWGWSVLRTHELPWFYLPSEHQRSRDPWGDADFPRGHVGLSVGFWSSCNPGLLRLHPHQKRPQCCLFPWQCTQAWCNTLSMITETNICDTAIKTKANYELIIWLERHKTVSGLTLTCIYSFWRHMVT